jgi:Superinfection immunity protein
MTLATAAPGSGAGSLVLGFVLWSLLILAYWVPTFVALTRHVPGKGQVVVVNLFLGWTGIGWVVALVMAFRSRPEPAGPVPYGSWPR